jgi:hypothetical protein
MSIKEKFKKIKRKYRKKTKIQSLVFDNEAIVLGADFWKHLIMELLSEKKVNKETSTSTLLFQIGMDLYQEKRRPTIK